MRRLLPAALALLSLGACAMDGASEATPAAPPIPPVSAPELLARRLPAEAAGFTRGALVPIRQPQVGVEQAYATPGRTAAAFVQVLRPAGGEQLPQGTSSPAVQQEYQRSVTEAERGTGPHRRLRVANEFNEPEADPIFRCAELEGTYGRQPVQSMICVGAAGGQLLRVRASMPRRTPALADSRAFLREIVSSMRNVPTPPEGG